MISQHLEAEIQRLHHAEKWPVGTIAAQLHVHHSTVRRVLVQAGMARASRVDRPSRIDPYLPFIKEVLATYPELTASRLFSMVQQRGYHGCPHHFRHRIA